MKSSFNDAMFVILTPAGFPRAMVSLISSHLMENRWIYTQTGASLTMRPFGTLWTCESVFVMRPLYSPCRKRVKSRVFQQGKEGIEYCTKQTDTSAQYRTRCCYQVSPLAASDSKGELAREGGRGVPPSRSAEAVRNLNVFFFHHEEFCAQMSRPSFPRVRLICGVCVRWPALSGLVQVRRLWLLVAAPSRNSRAVLVRTSGVEQTHFSGTFFLGLFDFLGRQRKIVLGRCQPSGTASARVPCRHHSTNRPHQACEIQGHFM